MKIIIVYELPQRELENDLLLKKYLELMGHSCDLIKFPFSSVGSLKKKYFNQIDAICVQSLRNDQTLYNLVYQAFGKVPLIINLQVEQVSTNKTEKDYSSYSYPKGMVKFAYHICWGEKSKENLINSGIESKRLIQTGPIQMDFLRPEFRSYFYNKKELLEKYNIPQEKKICLFISSFSYVGLSDSDKKFLKSVIGEERFSSFEKVSNESFDALLIWFERILMKDPGFLLVYRSHPAENTNDRLKSLSERYKDSFRVISDYSVKQWILVSDSILTWYSTSAAEAYFANKNVLILRPKRIDKDDEVTILNNAEKINTYEEFVQAINNGSYSGLDPQILKKYYDYDTITPAFIRIGKEIINLYSNPDNYFPWHQINTNEYDITFRKQQRKSVIYKIYGFFMRFFLQIEENMKIQMKGSLQKRIDNQRKEREKKSEQKMETERIMKRANVLYDIVKSYTATRND